MAFLRDKDDAIHKVTVKELVSLLISIGNLRLLKHASVADK